VRVHPVIALVLGVVEGLTEYLPVSSTGHLILAAYLVHATGAGADAFEIVIQLGAVLAVVVHYRALLAERLRGLFARDPKALRLFAAIAVAFVPTAVVGFLLRKIIKAYLFGPIPVAIALVIGGAMMIGIERVRRAKNVRGADGLEHVTLGRAFAIGLGQCVSMCPGSSRSMCTIVAGQLTGLSTATAAEFSFLLALPTLGAATLYEGFKSRHELATAIGSANIAIGLVVSFFVAWAVIAGFLAYLKRRGLEPFGWYRIVIGVVVLFVLARS
jgi:undecaprenyl-diphosphatase